jgi:hypothetical protein
MWCIPPEKNAEFVCCMENVLETYRQPYSADEPVICMDEVSVQLIGETRQELPMAPGEPVRCDYEYERKGTANIFMVCEPLKGFRQATVTERRTRMDWAKLIREVVDDIYPHAKRIKLVMDNLNTHGFASLYEAFEPAEARRIMKRLEIIHTPKHGSWLNMAEIELSVLTRQCLSRRIGGVAELKSEVTAWESERNRSQTGVDWQFTAEDARIKLKRLYPKVQN